MLIKWIRCCELTIQRTTARAFSDKHVKKGVDYQGQLSSSADPETTGRNRPLRSTLILGGGLLFLVTHMWGLKITISGKDLTGSVPSSSPSAGSVPRAQQGNTLLKPWQACTRALWHGAGEPGYWMQLPAHKVGCSRPGQDRSPQIPPFSGSHTAWLWQLQEWVSVSHARLPGFLQRQSELQFILSIRTDIKAFWKRSRVSWIGLEGPKEKSDVMF